MRLGRLGPTTTRTAAAVVPVASSTPTCAAPSSTLYFAPDGRVLACCVNNAHPLGRIGEQTLREIWQGARIEELRRALSAGDFSVGCEECGERAAAGNRAWSNAPQFDRWSLMHDVPPFPRRMDFVLSNRCNLLCQTCNGYWSSAIRARREHRPPLPSHYDDSFFHELEEFLPHLEQAVFLGGEPFLARESRRVWDLLRTSAGDALEIQVVSNGTQWDARIEQYLTDLPMSVSVSVDGATRATFERLRTGADFAAVMGNVDRYETAVTAHGGRVGYHYCLVTLNWHEFGQFLLEAEERNRYVQVMTVTNPAHLSLFHLPAGDLARILSALEHEAERVAPQLRNLRPVWDAELDRLRRHLEVVRRGLQPRWTRVSAPRRSNRTRSETNARVQDRADRISHPEAEAELGRWSGQPPLVLLGRAGVVTQHESPTWATGLDLPGLIGVPVNELDGAFARQFGTCTKLTLSPATGGLVKVEATFGSSSGTVSLRAIATEWDDGGVRQNRVVVALRDNRRATSDGPPDDR